VHLVDDEAPEVGHCCGEAAAPVQRLELLRRRDPQVSPAQAVGVQVVLTGELHDPDT